MNHKCTEGGVTVSGEDASIIKAVADKIAARGWTAAQVNGVRDAYLTGGTLTTNQQAIVTELMTTAFFLSWSVE